MSFYGLLLLGSVMIAILAISYSSVSSGNQLSWSGAEMAYSNVQLVGAFATAAENGAPLMNATQLEAWKSAVAASAMADGFEVEEAGNTIVVSTMTEPKAYSIISPGVPDP